MILPDFPFRVEFEVTGICNLICKYCYAKPFSNISPPIERLCYLFKKTKEEADPFEIILLGGEPFIRNDIIEVIELANKLFGSRLGLSTNGTLLSKLSEDKLARLKVAVEGGTSLQVSLDSINPKVNDITRGGTEATLRGIQILEEHKIPFSIGIVLTTVNQKDIMQTISFALSKYSYMNVLNLEPSQPTFSLKTEDYFKLKVGYNTMVKTYNDAKNLTLELNREDVKIVGVLDECGDIKEGKQPLLDTYSFRSCTAGLLRSGVLVDGSVTPCVTIRDLTLGNLYEESWRSIWKRSVDRFTELGDIGGQCVLNLLRQDSSNSIEAIKQSFRERERQRV